MNDKDLLAKIEMLKLALDECTEKNNILQYERSALEAQLSTTKFEIDEKLLAEVERLRAALEKYADKQNWGRSRSGYADRFMLVEENDCFGWDIASEALKGGEG